MCIRDSRRGGRKEIEDAIRRLRAAIPNITLRTTLIAGFPGETEEQYSEPVSYTHLRDALIAPQRNGKQLTQTRKSSVGGR